MNNEIRPIEIDDTQDLNPVTIESENNTEIRSIEIDDNYTKDQINSQVKESEYGVTHAIDEDQGIPMEYLYQQLAWEHHHPSFDILE